MTETDPDARRPDPPPRPRASTGTGAGWRAPARVAISLGLLALLAATLDLAAAGRLLLGADPWAIAALVALAQLQVWLQAARWHLVAARLGLRLPAARAVGEYYVGTLLNQLLPGGVAGDAVRAWRHRDAGHGGARSDLGRALRAVVLERFAGQVAFLGIAAVGVAAWPLLLEGRLGPEVAAILATGGAVLLAVLAALALATRIGPRRWRGGVAALAPEARRALLADGAWRVQAPLNLAIGASFVAGLALAAAAVGPALPWIAWVTVVPLTLLALVLPVSVGGWGLRESAAAALWPLVGLAPEYGVAAGLLYGLSVLTGSLPGLLLLAGPPARPRRRPA